MKNARYDFADKRLIGCKFYLQWLVREFPDRPESYDNQQTSVGCVMFCAGDPPDTF